MMFRIFFIHNFFEKKYFAALLFFAFNIFYILIDINLFSPFKIGLMCICPFVLIYQKSFISKAFVFGVIYLVCTTLCAFMHPGSFRISTLVYLSMFMFMFLTFYTLIKQGIWELDFAIKLIKLLITLYVVFFLLQQICLLIGIRRFIPLNLSGEPYLEVFKTNSLSLEPSHSARIMSISFFTWLKLNEFKDGMKVTLSTLFCNHKWFFIGFLYTMFAMGSGTAMISLLILSLYFFKPQTLLTIPVLVFAIISINEMVEFAPLNRAMKVLTAIPTMDANTIGQADGSAFYRIAPIINTIKEFDLTSATFWFGYGIDSTINPNGITNTKAVLLGNIANYGLISFLFLLLFLYSSIIRKFFCLETLFFVILLSCTIGNGYYMWGVLMSFFIISHFEQYDAQQQTTIGCH